jgi:hypothetical protein
MQRCKFAPWMWNISSAPIVSPSRPSGPSSTHQPSRIMGFWRKIAILVYKRFDPVQFDRKAVCALSRVVSQQAPDEPWFNGIFIANAATRGLTNWSKSETLMRITSQCVPALNAMNSAAAILSSSNTGNPKRLPKGGIAPNSHSGKSSANSLSAARRSWLNCSRRRTSPKSTIWSAGRTSSPGPLSATYTTVFAKVSGSVRSADAVSQAV